MPKRFYYIRAFVFITLFTRAFCGASYPFTIKQYYKKFSVNIWYIDIYIIRRTQFSASVKSHFWNFLVYFCYKIIVKNFYFFIFLFSVFFGKLQSFRKSNNKRRVFRSCSQSVFLPSSFYNRVNSYISSFV